MSGPPSHSVVRLSPSLRTHCHERDPRSYVQRREGTTRTREGESAREREKERGRKEGGGEGVRACLMPRPAVFGVHLAQLDRLDGRTVIAAPCTQSPCLRLPKPPKVRGRLPIITHLMLKSYA